MKIKYDVSKIKEILNGLYNLTGITIVFLDTQNNSVSVRENCEDFCTYMQNAPDVSRACNNSDVELLNRCKQSGKYEYHLCHFGLYDSAMPVIKSGIVAGYLLMGRIRSSDSPSNFNFCNDEKALQLYNRLPFFSDVQLESLRTLLTNMIFSNAIEIERNEIIEEISEYIEKNVCENLSVGFLCNRFFISKNRLYKDFKEHYNVTPNEYVTDVRIKKAKQLLLETKLPVYNVCESVGIDNYTYFSSIFKKKTGLTPTEYRSGGK